MSETLVIQSHRSPAPYPWIERCLASVRQWSSARGFRYCFLGDELFDAVPGELMDKTRDQRVVATDLARLRVLQEALRAGFGSVVWLDADVLVFDPGRFILPPDSCAVGREVWVQRDAKARLRVYRKVHNACLLFRRGNSVLDFYAETAQRLLRLNSGAMPPQFIGPKLLSALHNVAQFPVMERAAMLSPPVIEDTLGEGGEALALFLDHCVEAPAAANLCVSSCDRGEVSSATMDRLVDVLLERRRIAPEPVRL